MRYTKLLLLIMALCLSIIANEYFENPDEYEYSGKDYSELAPRASSHMSDPEWLFDLGWAYYEAGLNQDALRYIGRALELEPSNAFLNAKMGDIYSTLGEKDSSLYYYEQAVENHYDYLEVWEKLVEIKPEYYANLGLLYSQKADEFNEKELVVNGQRYLNRYLQDFPDGEYAGQCQTAISKLELMEKEINSRENLDQQTYNQQALEAQRKANLKADRTEFRENKPFIAGLGFYSVVLADDHEFVAKKPEEVIDDTLSMKNFATNLNEFGICGGYVTGPFILRGAVQFGSTSSGKNYFLRDPVEWEYYYDIDSSSAPWDSTVIDSSRSTTDDVRPKVSSINTFRFSVSGDYNFYYMNPILLYAGVQADFGIVTLDDSPMDNFEKIAIGGFGLGGGIMLRFSDFLFDLGYRRDVIGSSKGGTITLMGMYKF